MLAAIAFQQILGSGLTRLFLYQQKPRQLVCLKLQYIYRRPFLGTFKLLLLLIVLTEIRAISVAAHHLQHEEIVACAVVRTFMGGGGIDYRVDNTSILCCTYIQRRQYIRKGHKKALFNLQVIR